MLKKKITIKNKLGLHARAAAKFVSHAAHFISDITVIKDGQTVNGKSIMGVMMLAATQGTVLELVVSGDDEADLLTEIERLANDRFGDNE